MRDELRSVFQVIAALSFVMTSQISEEAYAQSLEHDAHRAFETHDERCQQDDGKLWGVSLCVRLVVVDPKTKKAVANAPPPIDGFEDVGGSWRGTLDADQLIANFGFDWEGERWVMLLAPLPSDENDLAVLASHEAFHGIQPQLGIVTREGTPDHFNTTEARILLRLEAEALRIALLADEKEWRRHASAALRLRKERFLRFPSFADDETALIQNEGLAEYTGLVIGRADKARIPVSLKLRHIGEADGLARQFAYIIGPAYALLLDRSGLDWRPAARLGAALPLLLESNLGPQRTYDELGRDYLLERIEADEISRAEQIAQRNAKFEQLFVAGPVLKAPVQAINFSFNPNHVYSFGEQKSVYKGAVITDLWGRFETETYVLVDWANATVIIPIEGDPAQDLKSCGDAELTIAEGWTVSRDLHKARLVRASETAE